MITEVLLTIILILLIILLIISLKKSDTDAKQIENVIIKAWNDARLGEKLGEIASHAREMKNIHRSIEKMLRVPAERGALGEIALETILADELPPDMFGIRKKILNNRIPDAYIKSTVGIICIDSKFPLENYRKMLDADDERDKENYKKQFIRDVRGHLDKIAKDYVCPEEGSAEFAFAYIPSEGVYWFLVHEAFEVLREYTKRGVQVVSPLTLSHKIELIKTGVHAKKLSEEADKIRRDLIMLSNKFREIDNLWKIFYQTHLRNLSFKADELNNAYKELRQEFEKISKLSNE